MFTSNFFLVFICWWSLAWALPHPEPGTQRSGQESDWQPYGPPPPSPWSGCKGQDCEGGQHHHHPNSTEVPNFTFEELWNLQNAFFTQFMYPNNAVQAKSINSSLLAPNILGRVDITRTFDGPELNTEYLFGLFAQLALYPNSTTLLGVPVNYSIIHFTANQNIVSSSAIIYFDFTSLGLVLPVEIDGVNVYNAQGQLEEYDATFRWFQYLLDTLVATVTPELGFNSTTQTIEYFTQALAESICVTEVTYCNGTNQQYANYSACYEFLTTQVRFGQAYELGMNTLLCRMIHENMVPYRPSVHCPHIGPTGGGYCTDDLTYVGVVTQPYFTNQPMVPYGYANANPTIAAM